LVEGRLSSYNVFAAFGRRRCKINAVNILGLIVELRSVRPILPAAPQLSIPDVRSSIE
jgi:hypothetical protein